MKKRLLIIIASLPVVLMLAILGSGGLAHAVVFDKDERQKVPDTNAFPWNGVVHIQTTVPNPYYLPLNGWCTGTFINAHTILTAAHCLYEKKYDRWVSSVTLRPAADGGKNPVYGEMTLSPTAKWLRVPSEYIETTNTVIQSAYDYGLILLPDNGFGSQGQTFFRPIVMDDAGLMQQTVTISGYPVTWLSALLKADPAPHTWVQRESGGGFVDVDNQHLFYRIDTSVGNSGGPIFVKDTNTVFQLGVVSSEDIDTNTGEPINVGTRITSEVYSRINFWSTRQVPVVRVHSPTTFGVPIPATLVVTAGNAWKPLASYSLVINADGWSDPIQLSGLDLGGYPKGGYFFYLKPKSVLGMKTRAYLPPSTTTTNLDFTNNPLGVGYADGNEDNIVNQLDYILWRNEFHCFVEGNPGCTQRGDFNHDGTVDIADYSLWHTNYFNTNSQPGEGWPESRPTAGDPASAAGSQPPSLEQVRNSSSYTYIYVKPDDYQYNVGDVVNMEIWLNTGPRSLTGTEVNIRYDNGVLELLDDDPTQEGVQATVQPVFGTVENNQLLEPGSFLLSTRNEDGTKFAGNTLLASMRFQAVASISQTSVVALFTNGWTTDSNSISEGSDTDQLDLVLNEDIVIAGSPARPEPVVSVFTLEDPADPLSLAVGALAEDPYNQVQAVEFTFLADGFPILSRTDSDGSDGWSISVSKMELGGPRQVEIQAAARLPGALDFPSAPLSYILDWTPPVYRSSSRFQYPEYIWISVDATDDFSGVSTIRAMFNTDSTGADAGEWVTLGDDTGDPGWIFWDLVSNPPSPGRHRVAFVVLDAAGNLSSNRVTDFPVYYFDTGVPAPGDFYKTLPLDGGFSGTNVLLAWEPGSDATSYEVCLYLSTGKPCLDSEWINIGMDTSLEISGLAYDTAYSWQVRALNDGGITYADGWEQAFSSFRTVRSSQFLSSSLADGWILESSEYGNTGGSMANSSTSLRLGDDAAKKQYRSILSFATGAGLPDTAVITKVTLKLKLQSIIGGGNPVTMLQGFMLDIKKGTLGTAVLQTTDFQTVANKTVGPFLAAPVAGWYTIDLTSAKAYINKLATLSGLTQIRVRFKLDDNNNTVANYLNLYSGNAGVTLRPQLIIEYYVP